MESPSETMLSSPPCGQPATPLVLTNPGTQPSPRNQNSSVERPLAEVITEEFAPFDAENLVVQPFQEDVSRDAKFEQELSNMLLNAILETHAWASARPKHEAAMESQNLEDQISNIMSTEREQGMCSPTPSISSSFSMSSSFIRLPIIEKTRAKLADFVRKMKTAIAALTDI
uniref:Uncharacterized protein n=1 Tax=Psilocybe cubensis TaxID=181762 RepID=A0A8H7XV87_PSICU